MKVLHKISVKNCKTCHILEKNDKKVSNIDRPTILYVFIPMQKLMTFFLLVFTFCNPINTQLAIFLLLCQSHIFLSISSSFPKNSFNFCSLLKYYKKPAFYQILYAFTKKSRFQFFFQKNARQPDRHENYHIL